MFQRTKPVRKSRRFSPAVDGLESRNLLTLILMDKPPGLNAVVGEAASTVHLGAVASDLFWTTVSATVDWGDGATAQADVTRDPSVGDFNIDSAGHAYQQAKPFLVTITAKDSDGDQLTWHLPVNVAPKPDATLTSTVNEIIGGSFHYLVQQTAAFADWSIVNVLWTVPGAYSANTQPPDSTGYHYTKFGQSDTGTDGLGDWYADGYWNSIGGGRTVKADVEFVENQTGEWTDVILTDEPSLLVPKGNIEVAALGKTRLNNGLNPNFAGWVIDTYNYTQEIPGITLWATVDPSSLGNFSGTFGIVQVVNMDLTALAGNVPYRGIPKGDYLDQLDIPNWPRLPYYQRKPVRAGQTLEVTDSPAQQMSRKYDLVSRYDSFTDVLMFKPDDGIPVPLGRLTWAWGGTAVQMSDQNRTWQLVTYSDPKVTQPYSVDPRYPEWQDSLANILVDGVPPWKPDLG